MLKSKRSGFWFLENLAKEKNIIHGFSGKTAGDMSFRSGKKGRENREKFLTVLRLDAKNLIQMEQVHRNRASIIRTKNSKLIKNVDGLVTAQKQIILGVKTADCLPILFYEPEEKIIGIAHAGWRGILSGIIPNVLNKMVKLGAKPENILVGIGPHIGGCCYTVLTDCVKLFRHKFSNLKGMIFQKNNQFHLDLSRVAVFQLEIRGIKKKNIEFDDTCTFCQNKDFFSFRKKDHGLMIGFISLIN